MNKVLYLVGIGPGDPELLTVKAFKLIKNCDRLFVPCKKKGSQISGALSIIKKNKDLEPYLKNKKIVYLHFPMVKGKDNIHDSLAGTAKELIQNIKTFENNVFITIGCPTIYSTAANLIEFLEPNGIQVRIIPGVSSINSVAAACSEPLVYTEEKLVVLPTTYSFDIIHDYLDHENDLFNTLVLMKVHSLFNKIIEILQNSHLDLTCYLIENASTTDERIIPINLKNIDKNLLNYKPPYMSTVIIKKIVKKNNKVISGKEFTKIEFPP